MRWPRKNDAASIRARQEALGINGLVTSIDLEPFAGAAETVTGVAVIPVSVVPVTIDLGAYELDDAGDVAETGRATETVHVPLAHTEGGLTASMTRGAKAAGTIRTHVLHDRITRASCFVCASAAEAIALARWLEGELDAMRAWLADSQDPFVSRHAKLREVKTHVVGPMCHVLWAWTTGDAVGPNMMTRNSYLLNMGYVMERAPVKPRARDPRGEHGRRQEAVVRVLPLRPRQDGHRRDARSPTRRSRGSCGRRPEDLEALAWAGTHGAVASGMQSVAFTPASAIAAVFTATGQDIGMVGTSSMAHGTGRRVDGGFHCSIRFPGLEVGTVGGGTTLPSARDWLGVHGLRRAGQGLPLRADRRGRRARARDLGVGRDGDRRLGELLPRAPRARRRSADAGEGSSAQHDGRYEPRSRRMLRIVVYGLVLIALMITIKNQRVLQRAHLVGACSTVVAGADGSEWRSCVPAGSPAGPGSSSTAAPTGASTATPRSGTAPRGSTTGRSANEKGRPEAALRHPSSLDRYVGFGRAAAPGAAAVRRGVEHARSGTIVRPRPRPSACRRRRPPRWSSRSGAHDAEVGRRVEIAGRDRRATTSVTGKSGAGS